MKMNVLCLLAGLFGLSCGANAQNAIWQQVFTAKTTTGASANVRNNGQAQHILYGQYTGCSTSARPIIILEGSFNNAVGSFIPISVAGGGFTTVVAGVPPNSFNFPGTGSYPFIRANVLVQATGCSLTAFYSGTPHANPAIDPNSLNSGFFPVSRSLLGGNANINQTLIVGDTTTRWAVNSNTAVIGTAVIGAVLQFYEGVIGSCTPGTAIQNVFAVTLPAITTPTTLVNIPFAIAPYYVSGQTGTSSSLCMSVSGATITDLSFYVIGHYEKASF